MINDISANAKEQMQKAVDVLKKQLAGIRTGRASVSLLDSVKIDNYGSMTPVAQVASISAPDARSLMIKPWDKSMLKAIEKAISEANLGLSAMVDSDVVRVPVPSLTEERRREFVKQCKQRGEDAKISVRNARRDANDMFKESVKSSDISEDDEKRGLKITQELTDKTVSEIDVLMSHKEAEIMKV